MDKIAVIINKKAQNSVAAKNYYDRFKEEKIPYKSYETEPENLAATIRKCLTRYKLILVGGGDGTVRTAAQHCAHTQVILGVLPLGTLNHFSKELELPNSADEIINSLKNPQTMTIDLAEVNGIIFINNSSLGFYPKFANTRDLYSKNYYKWLSYIPGFINSIKKHKTFLLTVKSKHLNLPVYTSFLMISNNLYSYEFPMTIKRENFQKSLLGLYFFKQGKIQLFKIIRNLFNNDDSFESHQSKYPIELHFNHRHEVTISLDGDTVNVKTPLIYKTLPKSLIVLTKSSCE